MHSLSSLPYPCSPSPPSVSCPFVHYYFVTRPLPHLYNVYVLRRSLFHSHHYNHDDKYDKYDDDDNDDELIETLLEGATCTVENIDSANEGFSNRSSSSHLKYSYSCLGRDLQNIDNIDKVPPKKERGETWMVFNVVTPFNNGTTNVSIALSYPNSNSIEIALSLPLAEKPEKASTINIARAKEVMEINAILPSFKKSASANERYLKSCRGLQEAGCGTWVAKGKVCEGGGGRRGPARIMAQIGYLRGRIQEIREREERFRRAANNLG